ncbi:MAG: EAL domain-containing protein [Hylemonella sp.]|nr:EAL domain-containing protein [Hylemonella sp.]
MSTGQTGGARERGKRSEFTRSLRIALVLVVALIAAFALYVETERRIDRANERLHLSHQLADQLRMSSEDLTRAARSYVQTGETIYRQQFDDILAIREGREPRPVNDHGSYWEPVTVEGKPVQTDGGRHESLLELIGRSGISEPEYRQLELAKNNSDALTRIEYAAMALVDTPGPNMPERRQTASQMLHDGVYRQAKADIMRPIASFHDQMDQRTRREVTEATQIATLTRLVVMGLGVAVLLALWGSVRKLRTLLGGTPDEVHAHIARLGQGNFREEIKIEPGRKNSVLGWLSQTQQQLHQLDLGRREASAQLAQLADFDPLTGLPNRRLLQDRVDTALSHAGRHGESLALMFLDLDRFKNINDTLGHHLGDELLVQVAQRLKSTLREEDTVCRHGGDEFVLLCRGTDANGAAQVARKVLSLAAEHYRVGSHDLAVTCSIGIAIYPSDGNSLETLSMSADTAMYRAKQAGRNDFRFFKAEMQTQSARTLQLENGLRRALELGQMYLEYQPQCSLHNDEITGVEALLRWNHPALGPLSPVEFIPVAEDSGQILEIGEWVLRTACRQLRAWQLAGLAIPRVAVNLSAVQFRLANLPERVSELLEEAGLSPSCLELELTESVAMENPESAIQVMENLSLRGVQMSIDDFGTGYSSLNYLKRLRVYKLKIDKSFVQDIASDQDDRAIVRAIVSLARSLGYLTIAEGVETPAQQAFLRDNGCDEMQGYYYSKPLRADGLEAFVRSRQLDTRAAPDRAKF